MPFKMRQSQTFLVLLILKLSSIQELVVCQDVFFCNFDDSTDVTKQCGGASQIKKKSGDVTTKIVLEENILGKNRFLMTDVTSITVPTRNNLEATCHIPFTYKNKEYYFCGKIDNSIMCEIRERNSGVFDSCQRGNFLVIKTYYSAFDTSYLLNQPIRIEEPGRYKLSLQKVFNCQSDNCKNITHSVSVKYKYENDTDYFEALNNADTDVGTFEDYKWTELSNKFELKKGVIYLKFDFTRAGKSEKDHVSTTVIALDDVSITRIAVEDSTTTTTVVDTGTPTMEATTTQTSTTTEAITSPMADIPTTTTEITTTIIETTTLTTTTEALTTKEITTTEITTTPIETSTETDSATQTETSTTPEPTTTILETPSTTAETSTITEMPTTTSTTATESSTTTETTTTSETSTTIETTTTTKVETTSDSTTTTSETSTTTEMSTSTTTTEPSTTTDISTTTTLTTETSTTETPSTTTHTITASEKTTTSSTTIQSTPRILISTENPENVESDTTEVIESSTESAFTIQDKTTNQDITITITQKPTTSKSIKPTPNQTTITPTTSTTKQTTTTTEYTQSTTPLASKPKSYDKRIIFVSIFLPIVWITITVILILYLKQSQMLCFKKVRKPKNKFRKTKSILDDTFRKFSSVDQDRSVMVKCKKSGTELSCTTFELSTS